MSFYIEQKFSLENGYPAEAAVWCNENNARIIEEDGFWVIKLKLVATQKELESQISFQAKAERDKAVKNIIVEVDGMKFQGDETSQSRMARVISAAQFVGADMNKETRSWILADNTIAEISIKQLAEALRLATEEQNRLWTIPYDSVS